MTLWRRTGSAQGQSTDTSNLQQQIDAEEAARIQHDALLGQATNNEASARAAGDAANAQAVTNEANARAAADALLLPIAQLCTQWMLCNLTAILPTHDPGGGRPWNNAGVITLGLSVGTGSFLGAENGTGWWLAESGATLLWG
jgi:hypothetical protein